MLCSLDIMIAACRAAASSCKADVVKCAISDTCSARRRETRKAQLCLGRQQLSHLLRRQTECLRYTTRTMKVVRPGQVAADLQVGSSRWPFEQVVFATLAIPTAHERMSKAL